MGSDDDVCFLLGNSPAFEFYIPTFQNTLFHLPRQVGELFTYLPMKVEQTEYSETSACKIQTPGSYPEENIQHSERSENLKSRVQIILFCCGACDILIPGCQQGRVL
jgi:hypothetical protein